LRRPCAPEDHHLTQTNTHRELQSSLRHFEAPIIAASLLQLCTSIGLFIVACAAMYWSLRLSYFVTLFLAVPAAALLVRVFIIQHDCGHGSFFASTRANNVIGMLCSVLTLTPYANWRRQHAGHHANWNNLDKRHSGTDIYSACLTVREYLSLTPWRRFFHRVVRHPLIAHIVIPPLVFLVLYRVPFDTPEGWHHERRAVYLTNAALLLLICGLGLMVGFYAVLLVQLPIIIITSIIGVWLFAVQHRFEQSLWTRQPTWRFHDAALEGSSYLKLPKVLQWFTGNIGFHNVHHLAPRIPNYRLEHSYRTHSALQGSVLTLRDGFSSIWLALWDEDRNRLVRFRDAIEVAESPMQHRCSEATG
jgi:omega-6 fatty acid desaturase (delta-12 desaturase)